MGNDFVKIILEEEVHNNQLRNRLIPAWAFTKWFPKFIKTVNNSIEIGDFKGVEVHILMEEIKLNKINIDEFYTYIQGLYEEVKGVNSVLLMDEKLNSLFKIRNLPTIEDKSYLELIFIKEIVEHIRLLRGIRKKFLHVVVVDGNEAVTNYVLHMVYNETNYLSLITDRPEEFRQFFDEVYEETGLIIQTIFPQQEIQRESQIILDLRKGLVDTVDWKPLNNVYRIEETPVDLNMLIKNKIFLINDISILNRGTSMNQLDLTRLLQAHGFLGFIDLNIEDVNDIVVQVEKLKEKYALTMKKVEWL